MFDFSTRCAGCHANSSNLFPLNFDQLATSKKCKNSTIIAIFANIWPEGRNDLKAILATFYLRFKFAKELLIFQ
jgi:hypothetical protein